MNTLSLDDLNQVVARKRECTYVEILHLAASARQAEVQGPAVRAWSLPEGRRERRHVCTRFLRGQACMRRADKACMSLPVGSRRLGAGASPRMRSRVPARAGVH